MLQWQVFGLYILEGSMAQKSLFWCGLFIYILLSFCKLEAIEILYVLNAPLCWDSVKIGIFLGTRNFFIVVTGIVTMKVSDLLVHAFIFCS